MSFEEVVGTIHERVTPTPAECEQLAAVSDDLVADVEAAITERGLDGDAVLVGSTARGTWLAGDRDIDVFVRFSPDLPRAELEERGLTIGHEVLPDGREAYAEHPYVKGERGGFEVDLVPCYAVEDAADIQSAVDRTPFHDAYLRERLDDDLAGDVRVAKALLKGIGVYGSDLRVRGFSGYLVELLILEYGGFRKFIEAAADWQPPVRFDPAGHGVNAFDDPLVVIDPTDPERNVAAVLSAANLARLQHYARDLIRDPRTGLFVPDDPDPLSSSSVRAQVDRRRTMPVAVRFDAPDLVEDQLYPQLDRSLVGVTGELDRRGFDPLRSARFADDTAVLFVECEVDERPTIERHEGPPVAVRDHAEGFFDRYADAEATGPYVEGDRYVVEREREFRTPGDFLRSDALFDVSLGKHVARALETDYEVLVEAEVAELAGEFGTDLARYFSPRP